MNQPDLAAFIPGDAGQKLRRVKAGSRLPDLTVRRPRLGSDKGRRGLDHPDDIPDGDPYGMFGHVHLRVCRRGSGAHRALGIAAIRIPLIRNSVSATTVPRLCMCEIKDAAREAAKTTAQQRGSLPSKKKFW
jgi:hypothetical protein